jgi:hypothetical protein
MTISAAHRPETVHLSGRFLAWFSATSMPMGPSPEGQEGLGRHQAGPISDVDSSRELVQKLELVNFSRT